MARPKRHFKVICVRSPSGGAGDCYSQSVTPDLLARYDATLALLLASGATFRNIAPYKLICVEASITPTPNLTEVEAFDSA